jgi:Putative MetA-pathway of phenol degradation/Chaperone of endosialidase
MKNHGSSMKPVASVRLLVAAMLAIGAFCPLQTMAQVPPRFYWEPLSGANAVPLIVESVTGNTNPFDPAHIVTPGASFDATLALTGYARAFSLHDRSAMIAIITPMGRISGDVTVGGKTFKQSTGGFGDPMIEFTVNVLGPRAQKTIPDALRYRPGFSVNLLGDLALPIGKYDSSQPLNLGQHRWYGRVGAPIVWQLGPWVPGRRTTLEFLPVVWVFGTNDNYVGQTLETNPLFQLDGHLTRDLTDHLWGAFDTVWFRGGKATINGVPGESRNDFGLGVTLGYKINDNLSLTAGYKSTINDGGPDALRLNQFMFSVTYGWHRIIEGSKRLKQSGASASSRRFKDNIRDMEDATDNLSKLRPVSFYYKPEYDDNGQHALQYGLIAEEVAKVYPELVIYDNNGQPSTVNYQLLAPMLLNELQKQQKVIAGQQEQISNLQQQLDRVAASLIGRQKRPD